MQPLRNIIIFGYTIDYWIERYCGSFLFWIILIIMIFWIKPKYIIFCDLIQEFPAIGMCSFGFLLTFLGIILQGNSEALTRFRSRKKLFERYVKNNKRIVTLSLFLSIYAYVIGYSHIEYFSLSGVERFYVALFIDFFFKFVCDFVMFIRVFYLLIRN